MRLNYDCIRDILLYIEKHTTYKCSTVDTNSLIKHFKNKYDTDTIYYHIRMISQADLVDDVEWADDAPIFVSGLSWNGHQYIDSIRDDGIWKSVKEDIKPLKSVPLNIIIQIGTLLIKRKLGIQ